MTCRAAQCRWCSVWWHSQSLWCSSVGHPIRVTGHWSIGGVLPPPAHPTLCPGNRSTGVGRQCQVSHAGAIPGRRGHNGLDGPCVYIEKIGVLKDSELPPVEWMEEVEELQRQTPSNTEWRRIVLGLRVMENKNTSTPIARWTPLHLRSPSSTTS